MHIALVISSLNAGGAERVLSGLANYWAKAGHKITVITLAQPEVMPFYPLEQNISIEQLGLNNNSGQFFQRLFHIFKRCLTLRHTIRSLQPDVVVSFIDIMNLTTLSACWNLRIPVVVSERTHPKHHIIPQLYSKLRDFLYPQAAKVIVQTKSAAEYFSKLNNIAVIPNSVTLPPILHRATESVGNIISVGRLIPSKNFETLIHAFSGIANDWPDLTLTIYGEGPERQNLENLVSHLHLNNRVFFPGVVQNIQEKIAQSDLFVFPSKYEGFPNAVCEAMAAGVPIIASDCSGNIDIIQDKSNGRLFPVGDVNKLTRLIRELIEDSQQRQYLSQEARKISDDLSQDKIYRLWNNLIREITPPEPT